MLPHVCKIFVIFDAWTYWYKTYRICQIHIALYNVQQQLKSIDPKQCYKQVPRIYRITIVISCFASLNPEKYINFPKFIKLLNVLICFYWDKWHVKLYFIQRLLCKTIPLTGVLLEILDCQIHQSDFSCLCLKYTTQQSALSAVVNATIS